MVWDEVERKLLQWRMHDYYQNFAVRGRLEVVDESLPFLSIGVIQNLSVYEINYCRYKWRFTL